MSITIIERELRVVDGLYCPNDLHRASGGNVRHKPIEFLRAEPTRAMLAELEREKVGNSHLYLKTTKGRNGGTYVCLELVYAYAMWISAAFYLKVIRAYHALSIKGDGLRQALAKAEIAYDRAKGNASDCGRGLRQWRFDGPVLKGAIAKIKQDLQLCLTF